VDLSAIYSPIYSTPLTRHVILWHIPTFFILFLLCLPLKANKRKKIKLYIYILICGLSAPRPALRPHSVGKIPHHGPTAWHYYKYLHKYTIKPTTPR
jgi:hypothetical protein